MKKIIGLLGFLSFFILNIATAQTTTTAATTAAESANPKQVMEHRLQKMKVNYKLTTSQVENLRIAHDDFAKKMSNFMSAGNDRTEIRKKVMAWKGELRAAYRKELTKEQYIEWATAQKQAQGE